MALIKTGTETATVTETENVTETVTAAETKDVAVKETAAAPAVASKPGSFWLTSPAIQQIVDEADTQTFDRIVGSSGNLKLYSTNKSVGNWITFQVMAEKRKRSISPNGPSGILSRNSTLLQLMTISCRLVAMTLKKTLLLPKTLVMIKQRSLNTLTSMLW